MNYISVCCECVFLCFDFLSSGTAMIRINVYGLRFVESRQMASPCRAKARTNRCSSIAACTLSDCAYAALFSVTLVLKQLLVFASRPLPLPPPDLDNPRAASVNGSGCCCYRPLSDRPACCWHADLRRHRSAACLIIGWQLVLAGLVLRPITARAAPLFVLRKVAVDSCGGTRAFHLDCCWSRFSLTLSYNLIQ